MKKLSAFLILALLFPGFAFASVSFDGTTNGYAAASASNDWIMAGDFCEMYWIKTSDVNSSDPVFQALGTASNWTNYINEATANRIENLATGDSAAAVVPANTNDGAWHAIIFSRSGSTVTPYQDNVAGTTITNSVSVPAGTGGTLTIGNNAAGAGAPVGKITRFAIVAAACSSGDRSTFQSSCAVPATTKVKYDFSGSGTLNTDTSGNSHTLTPHGTGAGWTYSTDEPTACTASPFNFGNFFPF